MSRFNSIISLTFLRDNIRTAGSLTWYSI